MYCEKCNKYYSKSDKYCNECGNELIEKEQPKEEKKGKIKKPKKNTALIIILIILGVTLIIGSTAFAFKSMIKHGDKLRALDYAELGNDKIPTMHLINNNITADLYYKKIENNYIGVKLEYNKDLYNYNIVDEYVEYLESVGFKIYTDDIIDLSNDLYLVKESSEKNKVLIVSIHESTGDEYGTTFSVIYSKRNGNIEDYIDKINYVEVGKEKYGYISIPDTWTFYDDDDEIIYYDENNTLVLGYYESEGTLNEIYNYIYKGLSDTDENIESLNVKVDNYDAYQISGYSSEDKVYYVIWLFQDNDSLVHYVEFDCTRNNNEVFKLIDTYKLSK